MMFDDDFKDEVRRKARAKRELVASVESRRTPADREYERRVNACISAAEKRAYAVSGPRPPASAGEGAYTAWGFVFSRAFHAEMDKLTLMKGIRRQAHQRG